MKHLLFLAALFATVDAVVGELPPQEATAVVHFGPDHVHARTFKLLPGRTLAVLDLDLGDSVEGALVELGTEPPTPAMAQVQVQVQYETSVTIMNEGPHLDLRDWKHFTSPWIDLERVAGEQFRVPTFSAEDHSRFPEVEMTELCEAVLIAGGERWAELVKGATSPHEYPAGVDISIIRLRAVRVTGNESDSVFTIEFHIPMGC